MSNRRYVFLICILVSPSLFAQPGPNDVFVRVADTGAALCCVVRMPGNPYRYMIYDAGNYSGGGSLTFDKVQEIIPLGSNIELMVLSHSDSDHLGAVDEICDAYHVRRVLRAGHQRSTSTWNDANDAIELEHDNDDCVDIELRYFEYPMGATYRFGDVFVTMVCGFHTPPANWGNLAQSERLNAGSIVVRLIYADRSILFGGDAVGRHTGDPVNACIATEQFMIDNADIIPIDSDVLIAPHHGGDNVSSTAFIQAVTPEFVIFSAGHRYEHPRAATAQRYLDNGVLLANMFRTDRGDDERRPNEPDQEWSHGRQDGHHDPTGDDDVDIVVRQDGSIQVQYRH
jgi:competence protein ComEC